VSLASSIDNQLQPFLSVASLFTWLNCGLFNQGNFTREGTLFSNLFVPVRSAQSQLISPKSVGKSIASTLEKPHLPTLLAADPLISEHDTFPTMQLLSVSVPL